MYERGWYANPHDGYAPRWGTLERGEAPSFFTLMQTCIPQTAEGFHEKLAELDDWKFNLVPKALDAVDVVLRGALSMKVASWRVWVFWMQLVFVASPTMPATC